MKHIILFFLLSPCASCFLFPKLTKDSFAYNAAGQTAAIPLVVPKGFKAQKSISDSSGAQIKTYTYSDGTVLYFAQMQDTVTMMRMIDTTLHIPEMHIRGGVMYKGIEKDYTFWREVRKGYFRAGYRNVTVPVEPRFDSAINYALERAKM